jgi:lysophospholipase L1-like esterase
MWIALLLFLQAPAAPPDPKALTERLGQLMESTAAAVPGLVKTSAVLAENTKGTLMKLQAAPTNLPLNYEFLQEARAYLALVDAMPKPYPLPETPRRQFVELRDGVEHLETVVRSLLEQNQRQLRSPDPDDLQHYAEVNDRLSAPAASKPRVVFLGASIIERWRLNEYFSGRDYLNRGISGQVTGQMLGRTKADVLDLQPRAVIIQGGSNDIARGMPARTIQNNLAMMAELCQAQGVIPILASILPVSESLRTQRPPATILQVNKWMQEYCLRNHYVYADYFTPLAQGGMMDPTCSDDGLHPNAKGYRLLAPIATKALDQVLNQQSPTEQKKRKPGKQL